MRYLAVLSFVCAFCFQAFSQITQVTLEPYLVHNGVIPELEGMTTYRVYAECANPNDEISAVYGDAVTPLSITSSEGFYQNPGGENTGWTINPSDFTSVPAREYDSWITIGASNLNEVVGWPPSLIGMTEPFAAFSAGGDLIIESDMGGAWFVLCCDTHAQAGSDLRVLIAQLTAPSNATIIGQVNIQIYLNGSSATEIYENLPLSYPCIEFVGCMDPDACNWDPEAECPDSSCILEDECGICGGDGIPDGYCDCEGSLPEYGYDCDGVCLNDEDGDGVCDEFEIAGCMDSDACDYDTEATDPVDCDYSCLVSMSLELLGVLDFTTPVGGTSGKGIHLLANADIEDMAVFGIGIANNGGGTDGQEFTFPSLSVTAGESLLLVRNQDALDAYFDSCWAEFTHIVQASTVIDQNGDDAIELYEYGEVIETFGDSDVDGTGQDWEYTDSWAYKWNGNWIFGGVNCTDGTQTIYESSCLYPLCSSGIGCTDPEACNYIPSAATDDGSCYLAAEGYNCDGLCLEDADGDGVCDPFEIAGCMESAACNYNPLATDEDNTCQAFDECGVCGGAGIPEDACDCEGNAPSPGYGCDGECLSDENQNGICDYLELEAILADLDDGTYCGEGTIWDAELGECIAYNPCPKDLDGDGVIGVEDLLQLLNAFGTECPDTEGSTTSE